MPFEDRYYQSRSFGLVTLRYKPVDETLAPITAVARAKEIPGRFCVAKISVRQGYQFKRCLDAEKFSAIKNVLLSELNISVAKMEPEIARVLTVNAVLKASIDTQPEAFKTFVVEDLAPTFQAKRTAIEMINAINYWAYEEELCNTDAVGNCVK